MPTKPKVKKLRPGIFLAACQQLLDVNTFFSCNAINRAIRADARERGAIEYHDSMESIAFAERFFYERLFGITSSWTFCQCCESYKEALQLRLMALALAHTLAVEQNAGRRVL